MILDELRIYDAPTSEVEESTYNGSDIRSWHVSTQMVSESQLGCFATSFAVTVISLQLSELYCAGSALVALFCSSE